jgi:hypothetical protein
MSSIELVGLASLTVTRSDEAPGEVTLVLMGEEGDRISISVGHHDEDAANLRLELAGALAKLDRWLADWYVHPDEYDAYVGDLGPDYSVRLEGVILDRTFPSKEIATYELARMMAERGCFPAAWFEGYQGGHEPLDDEVRAFHDEGGDKLLELWGRQYEDGAEVLIRDPDTLTTDADEWTANVVRDYGVMGVVYRYPENQHDYVLEHTDRDRMRPVPDDEDDDR